MIGDLSVYHSLSEQVTKQIDTNAASLGFDFVFSNLVVTSKTNDLEKQVLDLDRMTRSRNGSVELIKAPQRSPLVDKIVFPHTQTGQPTLIVLTRVTIVLQNNDKVDVVQDSIIKKVANDNRIDCVCIRPANETQLMDLITNRERYLYDMLSIDVSTGHFFQQIGTVSRAIKAGKGDVMIELEMSQLFRNSSGSGTEVTNVVNQSRMILKRLTGIVVSSGAKSAFEMRSPVDLINWAEGV